MPSDDSLAAARLDLVMEQAHLDRSRQALSRMRERTASMSTLAGDRVSGEYLKFTLYKRMQALEDDPEVPLFFGRLDYGPPDTAVAHRGQEQTPLEGHPLTAPPRSAPPRSASAGERFYIGRRHVTDEEGDPMVVDWRAPISRPFYRASRADPMGLRLRRRFGFQHGVVTAFEDEDLLSAPPAANSAILEAEIERPRLGPMRDIVATIQPEQDDIVRADITTSVCVQGAPGTGKTAVGLHRAAYLLYAHRDRLSRQGVLVVGPNASFLRYIGDVLPALGEIDARQTTVEELVAHVKITAVDEVRTARIKGDGRMAEVINTALWSSIRPAAEALVVPSGARRWRIPAYEADEIVAEIRHRGVRYGAGRAMLPQRLASAVLVKMELSGDAPDDRVQNSVARSKPVKQYAEALWPRVDSRRLVRRLLSDPVFLEEASAGLLSDSERVALGSPTPGGAGRPRATWSLHDAVLVDEARDLLERTPSLGHVVLDEAQDLSPMMLRSVGRYCSTGSATVLGDVAQATTPWGVTRWDHALAHLGKVDAHIEELTLGFRVPGDVIEYAARLLPIIAPGLTKPTSVRRAHGELKIVSSRRLLDAATEVVRKSLVDPGSIGLIVPDDLARVADTHLTRAQVDHSVLGRDDDMEARVDVVPATLAKGLEFDTVILVEPADIASAEADSLTGLRRLYVCLTRAVTSLVVVHAKPLPPPL